jgi:acetyl-CoA/propionyl-CoA carboxylase biotin carboxyl carrier protein
MQATIVKLAVKEGDFVQEGDLVLVLEAMKMEQPITAHRAGKVSGIWVAVGDTISSGTKLLEITD